MHFSLKVLSPKCLSALAFYAGFFGLCLVVAGLSGWPRAGQARPAAPKPRLEYHFRWDGQSPRVQVRLVYTAATPDSTVFTFGDPGFGGQNDIFEVVSRIAGTAPDQVLIRASQRQIVVQHHAAGLHTLTYELTGALPTLHQPLEKGDLDKMRIYERFRPVVTPSLLYLTSVVCLLEAAHHPAKTYSVQWDAFPAHTPYFFSPAPTAKPRQKTVVRTQAEGYFLLVAGTELQLAKYRVQHTPYYVITSARDTVNRPAQLLAPFFTSYFPALQDYWHEAPGPYYFLSVLPLHWPAQLPGKKRAISGYGLQNGFSLGYGGELGTTFKAMVAHETSHAWLGGKVSLGKDSFEHQWFGEGFNDYVCIVNLVRAGLFTDDFLPYVNDHVLKLHYTSPVRGLPNDSIAAKFWTNTEYEKLPYRRGFLYAFYLDNQIRLASAGRASLRDCLLLLLARSQQLRATDPEASLSLADFTEAVAHFLPRAQVEQELNRYIIKGEPLDFSTTPLVPGLRISYEQQLPVLYLEGTTTAKDIYR